MKIVFVPLDERPCNDLFPRLLAEGTDVDLVTPGLDRMGLKKRPADVDRLWEWLLEEVKDADGAILSLDTLLYGGIIPSRLHSLTVEQCEQRLKGLKKLKERNPSLKLYAFNLIMRCPKYSSSDEEPDYYGDWGREIFLQGYIHHRIELGIATEEEKTQLAEIEAVLPREALDDYVGRRAVNRAVNRLALEYVQDGTIDFMSIPQDDSAPYGLTAIDQQLVRTSVGELGVELQVYMYPGADEVGCTLLARMVNEAKGRRPLIYAHFASANGPFVTPAYEDRLVYESVKYQILAAGGLMCTSMAEADLILCINMPGDTMMEAVNQDAPSLGYTVMRNITELTVMAAYAVRTLNKPCVVADIAFANGSDLTLFKLLRKKGLLFELAGYAGWNTSSNTLGTCIAQGMLYAIYGDTKEHRNFLAHRFVEDAGYCSRVRRLVANRDLPGLGLDYFQVDGQRGRVSAIVKTELEAFVQESIANESYRIVIDDCYMPWSRMFEVGLAVHVEEEEKDPA
ncbi:hypothetical protein J31TS4_47310 [Paenibacillus sp. J31TS4]|uniref:DUF4127 family protein n=1 Tax=Paenibacillus sp. J31TS4 TaxID=2807195 RepID=UPI001B163E76|nr:DUF4127 family protein [Paenibacillus sp. J31TS4]GIP41451.1 hypothetical protein J31TS4_47310 [Paenibacillus sp. J31TS4]